MAICLESYVLHPKSSHAKITAFRQGTEPRSLRTSRSGRSSQPTSGRVSATGRRIFLSLSRGAEWRQGAEGIMLSTECRKPNTQRCLQSTKHLQETIFEPRLICEKKKIAPMKSSRMLSERCVVKVVSSLQTWRRQEVECEHQVRKSFFVGVVDPLFHIRRSVSDS